MARIRYVGLNKNFPAGTTNKHKKTVPTLAREVIRVSDIILEILDSRYIAETRNVEMENEIKAKRKKIIYVLNKADLVDMNKIMLSGELRGLKPYVFVSCKKSTGRERLRDMIKIEVKKLRSENSKKMKLGVQGEEKEQIIKVDRRAHVGIIGYPNTGKSTLTNILTGKGGANASFQSGFTKGIQKVKFNRDILILDSPGLIPEKENSTLSSEDLKKHGKLGVSSSESAKEPEFIVDRLVKENPGVIEKFYGLDSRGDSDALLESLGRKWGFLIKGNFVNRDKAARRILEDWQKGKMN